MNDVTLLLVYLHYLLKVTDIYLSTPAWLEYPEGYILYPVLPYFDVHQILRFPYYYQH